MSPMRSAAAAVFPTACFSFPQCYDVRAACISGFDRITQSYLYAGGSPYCWFVGFCSYEGKTAWVTDKAPIRKFDKFAQ